jgi:hypothetical protein
MDAATIDREAVAAGKLALLGRFPEPGRLRVCHEAGPAGYELARLLHAQGSSAR